MPVACLVAHAPSFTTQFRPPRNPGAPTTARAHKGTRPHPHIRVERSLDRPKSFGEPADATPEHPDHRELRRLFVCRQRLLSFRQRATPERQRHGMKHQRPCLPLRGRNACSVFNSGRIVGVGPRKSTVQPETFRQCTTKRPRPPEGRAPALMHSSRHRSEPFSILSRLTNPAGKPQTTKSSSQCRNHRTLRYRRIDTTYEQIIDCAFFLRSEANDSAMATNRAATLVLRPRIGFCHPSLASNT